MDRRNSDSVSVSDRERDSDSDRDRDSAALNVIRPGGPFFFWHRAWSPDVDDQRRAINAKTVHLFGMGDAASSGSAERLNWTEADEAKLVG